MDNACKLERTCIGCGYSQAINVTNREAAFELVDHADVFGVECPRCRSSKFASSREIPEYDFELLSEWAVNEDLMLMSQDEDLMLADGKHLEIILPILDSNLTLASKRELIISALCVIVYDHSNRSIEGKDDGLKKRVIMELNCRKELLIQAKNSIGDYVQKVVFPQLENFLT